jgi:hypothetical protein
MSLDDAALPDPLAHAARALAEAVALVGAGREQGRRERARRLVEEAIAGAERARASAEEAARRHALATLAGAHAARAEDALHGAGQLSLGSQRAPTPEACDAGWRRVEAIVGGAEASARAAESAARALDDDASPLARAARASAAQAEAAARTARRLVDERNHAYTFHADPGFSFGEGWYVAAAAVLDGAAVQVEPGRALTAQATRFLCDAGLGERLVPHRSRPRANKATTAIVARAFRADPRGAQARLRAAFLGDAPVPEAVRAFVDARLPDRSDRRTVLLWIRDGVHHRVRNTAAAELCELARLALAAGLRPIVVGDALRGAAAPAGAIDMTFFWKDPLFRGDDGRRAQLQLFEHLRAAHATVGQLGVTTAGMDGPALMGMPTMYLTAAPNPRMGAWVGVVPGYVEVVRDGGHLERVRAGLAGWASAAASTGP